MQSLFADLGPMVIALSACVALLAGIVKGAVGFAMPMVMISGLSSLMAPDLALAALILPTVLTNGVQALRHGLSEALGSVRRFGLFLAAGGAALVATAQLVAVLPQSVLLLFIGIPVVAFAVVQIAGWRPSLTPSRPIEAGIGAFAGAIGGVSGVWGPPTVLYLTAIETPKRDQLRIQGVIYGLGAVALIFAHLQSGVFGPRTWGFSAVMVAPAFAGLWLGFRISDQIDQATFRKATLLVLALAGANLVRRGLVG